MNLHELRNEKLIIQMNGYSSGIPSYQTFQTSPGPRLFTDNADTIIPSILFLLLSRSEIFT